jgi:Ca-activated chloride channel family protein
LSNGAAYPESGGPEAPAPPKPNVFKRIADALLGRLRGDKPAQPEKPPGPMENFEAMVGTALSEWLQSEAPESGDSEGLIRFNRVLDDWFDGVKHFDSALRYDPSLADARHNRTLTVKYLKRLREILEELQENAQQLQQMPQPGQGEGQGNQPQPEGDGEGEEEGEGQGDEEREGQGGEGEEQNQGQGGERPDEGKGDGDEKNGGNKPKDDETPEEAARRILRENADFEKGALRPGQHEYRQTDKDW